MRRRALQSALLEKAQENNFIVLDELRIDGEKTKAAAQFIKQAKHLGAQGKVKRVLILMESVDALQKRLFANVAGVSLALVRAVNAYDILASTKLVMARSSFEALSKRLRT